MGNIFPDANDHLPHGPKWAARYIQRSLIELLGFCHGYFIHGSVPVLTEVIEESRQLHPVVTQRQLLLPSRSSDSTQQVKSDMFIFQTSYHADRFSLYTTLAYGP